MPEHNQLKFNNLFTVRLAGLWGRGWRGRLRHYDNEMKVEIVEGDVISFRINISDLL